MGTVDRLTGDEILSLIWDYLDYWHDEMTKPDAASRVPAFVDHTGALMDKVLYILKQEE